MVKALDTNGRSFVMEAKDGSLLARAIQHEFDHLDGIVYTDHLKGLRRQLMAPKLKQLVKGLFRADYKVKPFKK
jgi:peptide deformylase